MLALLFSSCIHIVWNVFIWAELCIRSRKTQINARSYGGLERLESERTVEFRPFIHCAKSLQKSPNNQQQLPLLRQSSPGINKPPNSCHSGAATCRPVNCTESSSARVASVHSKSTAWFPLDQQLLPGLRWCLTINYKSVAQISVQALQFVAQAYGKDAGMLFLHVSDS